LDAVLSFISRFNPERSNIMAGGVAAGAYTKPEAAIPLAATGFAADKLQAFLRQKAAERTMSGLLSGTTPAPVQPMTWRGLMSGATVPPVLE
jgi:hypothetical protein